MDLNVPIALSALPLHVQCVFYPDLQCQILVLLIIIINYAIHMMLLHMYVCLGYSIVEVFWIVDGEDLSPPR